MSVSRLLTVAAALLCLFMLPASAQTRLALVIGNGAYSGLPALPNPANDARLIASELEKAGFKVSLSTDQTQSQMKSGIATFVTSVEAAGGDTLALLYYAGHGVQIDGVNYLVPVDTNAQSSADVVLGAVSASDVLRTLELARAKVNIVVLDACRDNPFKAASRSMARGLARIDAPAGSIVAYSTAPGQVALDGNTSNSPYAEALAKHIASPGLAIEEVFRKVRIDVSEKTKGAQVPWEETSLTQEVKLNASAQSAATETPVQVPTTATSEVDAARAYLVAVGENTIQAYDQFIKQFPNAKDTPQAMRNLAMLNDESNWQKAKAQNTRGAYSIYLNLHPDGAYVNEANEQLAMLTGKKDASQLKQEPGEFDIPEQGPNPLLGSLQPMSGFDVFGDDLKPVRDVTFEECQNVCTNMQGCVALAYRADLRRCYPKSSATLITLNSKVDSAITQLAKEGARVSSFEFLPQTDVPGGDYSELKLKDPQACLRACENDTQCNAFAFATNIGMCYLKASASSPEASPNIVAGVRR
jgi:uncharacterized caspase-like protein